MSRPLPAGRPGLPLAVWAGVLSGAAVVAACTATAVVLAATGGLTTAVGYALGAGAGTGAVVSLAAVAAARHLARALRRLSSDAVQRLHDPSAPVQRAERRPLAARATTELAELARTLDALHLRVRVADEMGARHRRDAETVGAGVFELLSGLVAAEEGARGQLAAELHDTVAQSLMIAHGILAGGATTPADVARVADYVQDAEEQVRAVMARTRPPALRDGDLASAVAALRMDVAARYGLAVQVQWPDQAHPLPLSSAITLYRFFQEALLNVVKHADVDDARLRLEILDDAVLATVSDDGPGFDPATVRPDRGRHVGLGLLRERARLAGGSLEVVSAPGAGTTLRLRLSRAAQVPPPARTSRTALPRTELRERTWPVSTRPG